MLHRARFLQHHRQPLNKQRRCTTSSTTHSTTYPTAKGTASLDSMVVLYSNSSCLRGFLRCIALFETSSQNQNPITFFLFWIVTLLSFTFCDERFKYNLLDGEERGTMAYLRREKEIVEVDFPFDKVWEAISKAAASLEWKVEETDEVKHQVKLKTKANFMAYASTITVDAIVVSEKITRVNLSAETPVTTVTGIVDFGRTRERIDSFLLALVKQLKGEVADSGKKEDE
jgi:hypothetical protein